MHSTRVLLVLASAAALTACATILGFEDVALGPGDAGPGGGSDGAAAEIPSSDAAAGDAALPDARDAAPAVEESLLGSLEAPIGITLDDTAAYVAGADAIYRIDKTTRAVTPLTPNGAGGKVVGITVSQGALFWASRYSSVWTCPASGCAAPTLTFGAEPSALGLAGDSVVWSEFSSARVKAAKKNDPATTRTVADHDVRANAVVADGTQVYVTNSYAGDVARLDLQDGGYTAMATAVGVPTGLVVTATDIYFGIQHGALAKVSKSGGGRVGFGSPTKSAIGLAADATHLYWADEGSADASNSRRPDGCIWRCALATCTTAPPEPILCGLYGTTGIAVDDRHVYFTTFGPGLTTQVGAQGGASRVLKPAP